MGFRLLLQLDLDVPKQCRNIKITDLRKKKTNQPILLNSQLHAELRLQNTISNGMLWQLGNKLQEEPNCITRTLERKAELPFHRSRAEKITKGLYLMNLCAVSTCI